MKLDLRFASEMTYLIQSPPFMTSCIYNVRQLCLVIAVVSALVTIAAGTPIQNCDWDAAASIDPSIRIMRMSFDEPRLMKGYAVRVDLNDKSLLFTANGRDRDWGRPMPDYTNEVCRSFPLFTRVDTCS